MTRWFRMYDEILDDPKVQKLPAEDFRAWVNLLALASKNGGVLPDVDGIAFALRRSSNDVETLLERLLNATLIDKRNGGANGYHYAPHGWAERQYKSDSSTERVQRFRNARRNCNATPPEPEPESEQNQTPQSPPQTVGSASGQKPDRLASALCRVAGIAKCGPVTVAHVSRWLGDGISEATITETVRGVAANLRSPARSLKVFDAPIRRAHHAAQARPPTRPASARQPEPPAEPEISPEEQEQVRELISGLARAMEANVEARSRTGAG